MVKVCPQNELRRIIVPAHRYSNLKEHWTKLVEIVVQQLEMQIRYFKLYY